MTKRALIIVAVAATVVTAVGVSFQGSLASVLGSAAGARPISVMSRARPA